MGEEEMITAFLALAITASPPANQFDMIEVNHVHVVGGGEYRFTQVIAWDMDEYGQWVCQGWVMINREQCKDIWPIANRTHRARFRDGEGSEYLIMFCAFKETRTAYDPEQINRRKLPMKYRKGIKKCK